MSNSTIGVLLLTVHAVGIMVITILHPVAVLITLAVIFAMSK